MGVLRKFGRGHNSELGISDLFVHHGDGFEPLLFDVVVAGLEVDVLEVDLGGDY